MTLKRRWKHLIALLAGIVLIGALATPAVHWRLVGRARGEPFNRARPAYFYSLRLKATADLIRNGGVNIALSPAVSKVCAPAEA